MVVVNKPIKATCFILVTMIDKETNVKLFEGNRVGWS